MIYYTLIKSFFTLNRILCLAVLFGWMTFSGCLKDDFDKLSDSEWSPELAFPIVYSDLGIEDIATQKNDSVTVGVNDSNIVEIIYSSLNYSKRASELISLPAFAQTPTVSITNPNIVAFNSNPNIGFTVNDSVVLAYSYSIDNQLSVASMLDTVIFKSGTLRVNITSQVPQNCIVRTEIPQLFINGQPFSQNLQLNSSGITPVQNQLSRDLTDAVLIPNGEAIQIKFYFQIQRSNAASLPPSNQFLTNVRFEDEQFRRISGNFSGLQMPVVTRDTMFIGIFRNVIEATELQFQNPFSSLNLYNSTGLPVQTTITNYQGFRPGFSIPAINPSSYNLPFTLNPQSSFTGNPGTQQFELSSTNGSGISEVVNALPKMMVTETSFTPITNSGWGFLLDTSRVAIQSELRLPLDGLTLNLLLVDTLDFDFSGITDDIEEGLIRINTNNGFPTQCKLQLTFCRRNVNALGQTTSLTRIDSLFTSGEELVLESGVTNSSGLVINPVQRITDSYIERLRWAKIQENQANCILIEADFTTFNQGEEIVKVFESNRVQLRLAARLKIRKSF